MTQYDPTDITEELNRKVIETLSTITARYKMGEISRIEFHAAVEAIWSSVAGLIRSEFQEILDEVLNNLKKEQMTYSAVFLTGTTPIAFSWTCGENKAVAKWVSNGELVTRPYVGKDPHDARLRYANAVTKATAKYGQPFITCGEIDDYRS